MAKVLLFVDNSNIFISAKDEALRREGRAAEDQVRLQFYALIQLALADRRRCRADVPAPPVAGGSPAPRPPRPRLRARLAGGRPDLGGPQQRVLPEQHTRGCRGQSPAPDRPRYPRRGPPAPAGCLDDARLAQRRGAREAVPSAATGDVCSLHGTRRPFGAMMQRAAGHYQL